MRELFIRYMLPGGDIWDAPLFAGPYANNEEVREGLDAIQAQTGLAMYPHVKRGDLSSDRQALVYLYWTQGASSIARYAYSRRAFLASVDDCRKDPDRYPLFHYEVVRNKALSACIQWRKRE